MEKLFSGKVDGGDDSDDDVSRLLDQNAAVKAYDETLGKIDNYLRAEMQLLNDWKQNDKTEKAELRKAFKEDKPKTKLEEESKIKVEEESKTKE